MFCGSSGKRGRKIFGGTLHMFSSGLGPLHIPSPSTAVHRNIGPAAGNTSGRHRKVLAPRAPITIPVGGGNARGVNRGKTFPGTIAAVGTGTIGLTSYPIHCFRDITFCSSRSRIGQGPVWRSRGGSNRVSGGRRGRPQGPSRPAQSWHIRGQRPVFRSNDVRNWFIPGGHGPGALGGNQSTDGLVVELAQRAPPRVRRR